MTEFKIKNIGTADVQRKVLVCAFNVSATEFFAEFGGLLPNAGLKTIITNAIDSPGDKFDINKSEKNDLSDFFDKVRTRAEAKPSTKRGFSSDEGREASQAENMKRREVEDTHITYEKDSDGRIVTRDSNTGEIEGEIILGDREEEGDVVPLKIIEKVETHYKFNAEEDIEEDRKSSGQFIIKNPSTKNKIWDVDVTFKKDKPASIDEAIHINNLDPEAEEIIEYEVEEFQEPALKIYEFISTINDEETETYSLNLNAQNVILFKLSAKNTKDYPLKDIVVKKEILDGYTNVDILGSTVGEAEIVKEFVEWKIEALEAGQEVFLNINMSKQIQDREDKPSTGKVFAEFYADSAMTGIEIDKFDAYSDNFVAMEVEQMDEDPDNYGCSVWFENESDFQLQIVNLDIVNPASGEKMLDIDPTEIPPLAAGATWKSKQWIVETEDGLEPTFHKTIEFFLLGDREINTMGSIEIDDIALAVAMIQGTLTYSIASIESFRVIPFDVLHQVKNTGGADLNEMIMKDIIQPGYIPPTPEEIEVYIVRPQDGDDFTAEIDPNEEIDWEDLGEQITLPAEIFEITPNDQEPGVEHTLEIKLDDLRESPIGMILPGTIIRAKYPLQAHKVERDTEFVSNVTYLANTYPAGEPLEFTPESITIPVEHTRVKTLKGKRVQALETEGHYEIVLTLRNRGEASLKNVQIRDVVPENFEYGEYSQEPTKFENLEGKDLLIWDIEEVEPDARIEISYKIKGIGDDYKASEAQFSV